MTKTNMRQIAALFTLLLWSAANYAAPDGGVVREDVVVLGADGEHFTAYKTLRSDLAKRQVTLAADESEDDLLYFHPDDFVTNKGKSRSVLSFDGGSYALIRAGKFTSKEVQKREDGSYQFDSWDGQVLPNGHYGKWNSPEPFERFSYVWVLPDTVEILDYNANGKGQWRQRNNTLVWSGKQVNDLTFRINYRVRSQPGLALNLSKVTQDLGEDQLSRITLDSGALFPSGGHELTVGGKRLLTELAQELDADKANRVIVKGHTDNQPLKAYLQETYPSNWELSAARATIVVRWLSEHGIDPKILEARAYGAQHPVADNATAQGRAKNRRIEILVSNEPTKATANKTSDSSSDPKQMP